MPHVEISLFPGRDDRTKEDIIREVSDAVARTSGAPIEAVTVVLHEVPMSHWAQGGVPYSKR